MEQMLQVERIPAYKEGVKYWTIPIMDVAFHTAEKRPTLSIGKKIEDAASAEKPGRIYGSLDPLMFVNTRAYALNRLAQNPDFLNFVREKEAEGYKVVVEMPKGGPATVLGADTIEFLNSKNGKRILRAIAKRKTGK